MDGQSEKLVVEASPIPRRTNRGWFRSGDKRINYEGRPRRSKLAVVGSPADCAKCTDRVMRIFVPGQVVHCCLTRSKAPWLVNLPIDFRIVECRVDAERKGVVFVIRSRTFPKIARGTLIPEIEPTFNGLMFC